MRTILSLLTATTLIVLPAAHAQVPDVIDFQARISDASGPMDGSVSLVLRLYTNASPVGGEALILEDSNTVTAVDGLVSTFIGDDVGPGQEIGIATGYSPLYVEMQANGTVLSPRLRVTAVAYAVRAGSIPTGTIWTDHLIDGAVTPNKLASGVLGWTDDGATVRLTTAGDNVRIGVASGGHGKLYVETADNNGVVGQAPGQFGVYGNAGQYGVYGNASFEAVFGEAATVGVHGFATVRTGVHGTAPMYGVHAEANNYGVFSDVSVDNGVFGRALGNYGVSGKAVTYGVYGNAGNYGVYGNAGNYGVYGNVTVNNAVVGVASEYGVYGSAGTLPGSLGRYGVCGKANEVGVWGNARVSQGVRGEARLWGVMGVANDQYGVYGAAANNYGVYGKAGNWLVHGNYGVYGEANNYGVYGNAGNYGVYGNARNYGVYGQADNWGVYGNATQDYGVYGYAVRNNAVYGLAAKNYGGYFAAGLKNAIYSEGNIVIQSPYNVYRSDGSYKAFTIDHPLDPCNRVLRHFSYEGPEAGVIYRGTATLDEGGSANVELPEYFDALSRNAQVQLTPQSAMPTLHAPPPEGNGFTIAGGAPNGTVYWQVTAERDDPKARLERQTRPVEDEKGRAGLPGKGQYVSPECY